MDAWVRGVWGQYALVENKAHGGYDCAMESSTAFKFGVGLSLTPLYLYVIWRGYQSLEKGHA